MPFYEYECQSCKFYTEVLQKVSDAPLRKCPSCGKSTLKKLVSAPNFRLKGGGWYETDFKSDQENKRNLAVEKEPEAKASEEPAKKAEDAKATDAKAGESKPVGESKSEVKPAKSAGQSSGGSISSRSSSARRPVSAKKKPAAKAAARRGRVRR